MTVLVSPTWWDHLKVAPLNPWWPKLELKISPHLAESIESEIMGRFWCSRSLNDRIGLLNMIGSFASGATASIVAKNWTNNLSQPFKELQGSNSEFKLITTKSFTGTHFDTKLSSFGLEGLPIGSHLGFLNVCIPVIILIFTISVFL